VADELRPAGRVTREPSPAPTVALGEWFWINWKVWDDDGNKEVSRRELVCITCIGSNYVKVKSPGGSSTRVHFNKFDKELTPEPDARRIIAGHIADGRRRVVQLMDEVRGIAARLGVGVQHALQDGEVSAPEATQQLSLRKDGRALETYKKDLVRAKDKTLPELFKQIETENKRTGKWMKAELLPLEGMVKAIEPVIESVKSRIFAVELYAGLVERVKRIRDGAPADLAEPLHLFQRRHYMDEECLLNYRGGGMRFKDLDGWERWLLRRENFGRILPFPRCVVAFRVRREQYQEDAKDWQQHISIMLSGERDADKLTFLYMRNGDRVYRLRTGIEFDEKLFPDLTDQQMTGTLYARTFGSDVKEVVTEARYQGVVEHDRLYNERLRAEEADHKRRRAAGDKDAMPPGPWFWPSDKARDYFKFSPDDVRYDEVVAFIKRQVDAHNRVVVVLQGLLDRSEVFHPHPPWQLWTPEGMAAGLVLQYDEDRALHDGPTPSFEKYRQRLNSRLAVGHMATGQDDYWQEREAKKYNDRNRYSRNHYSPRRYQPYGNPGPGVVAEVRYKDKAGCTFKWQRPQLGFRRRFTYGDLPPVKCSVTVPLDRLLNVTDYRPGDYRQFYADPRTRADYLKWAPYMLAAEDWHAAQAEARRTAAPKQKGGRRR
jgi:ribosomal protein L33